MYALKRVNEYSLLENLSNVEIVYREMFWCVYKQQQTTCAGTCTLHNLSSNFPSCSQFVCLPPQLYLYIFKQIHMWTSIFMASIMIMYALDIGSQSAELEILIIYHRLLTHIFFCIYISYFSISLNTLSCLIALEILFVQAGVYYILHIRGAWCIVPCAIHSPRS